ncbi:MAG: AMP-binding protein [Deltaproteobacteria bacterium]|nr:AMP-binding protein [Deltaproteobacteria bacterium]
MNYANYACLHARNLPNKTCLIERTPATGVRRTLTWKEFNQAINRVANYLSQKLQIGRGDYVMHLQNNSLEWLISYYAIIKLGAVVVPLNFRFVGSDIKFAAEVAQPKAFILGSEFLSVVEPVRSELQTVKSFICVGDKIGEGMLDYRELAAYADTTEAIVEVESAAALAMMFTSGTTGKPKPVLHTHFSLNNTAIGNGMSYFVEKNDNYLFFLPLYHSGTMFLWAPFYATGATGTILRDLKDPKWIIEALAEEKATDVLFVVPIAVGILNAIDRGEIKLADYDLSAWRYMEIGAQPVPFDVMKRLVETLPCAVSNIYGITEGGGGGTFNLYPDEVLARPGSIGKPTFGVEARLVDFAGNEVPPEEVGELIFRTPRMMQGYFGNPEMTAESLKDGWLYTGDLLKTDADGYYYIVDRKKDMITSGGENIFPVEIEDALMEHPDVDDVACIGTPDERLVEAVMAIVQLKEGRALTAEELLAFAKTRLATYKLPRVIKFDQVMRNPTGKLMKPQMREKYTGRKEAFQSLV